jgi:hypothetical protein
MQLPPGKFGGTIAASACKQVLLQHCASLPQGLPELQHASVGATQTDMHAEWQQGMETHTAEPQHAGCS